MATTRRRGARAAFLRAALLRAALALTAAGCAHGAAARDGRPETPRHEARSSLREPEPPWASHVAEVLRSRVPGLDVRRLSDGRYDVRLRRERAIGNDGEPLFVLDGVPLTWGRRAGEVLDTIDPRDVVRVEVLRGAAAALYGDRGQHGVIAITSRRGRR